VNARTGNVNQKQMGTNAPLTDGRINGLLPASMSRAMLKRVVAEADRILCAQQWEDWPLAKNGLQFENNGQVTRLAAAVDFNWTTVRMAVEAKVDLLLVHHGLMWSSEQAWTGRRYAGLRHLVEHNLAVYSSHLPLDAHPKLGNNVLLCRALGLRPQRPFFLEKGRYIGTAAEQHLPRHELEQRLRHAVGHDPVVIRGGPEVCQRIGIVSGGGGDRAQQAMAEGVDTFVTGEGPHWTYNLAQDLGINILYGGHYATETFGVKALADHLARKFKLPWLFLDNPSGL
jgi:dinuclear metal center YbgI/SA1388 family protein